MTLPHSCIKDSTEKSRCPLEKSIAEKKMKSVVMQLLPMFNKIIVLEL